MARMGAGRKRLADVCACRKGDKEDAERYQNDVLQLDRMAKSYQRDKAAATSPEQ